MTNTIQKILQANPLAENTELSEEISAAINRVLLSGQYIQGPRSWLLKVNLLNISELVMPLE